MRPYVLALVAMALTGCATSVHPPIESTEATKPAAEFREDALALERLVQENYAYPERLPNGQFELTPRLRAEAEAVSDQRTLLRFSERALLLLADHHAITGSSLNDSFALVPSFSDLWVEPAGAGYVIEAVRSGSPAEASGIRAGDTLLALDGVPVGSAVAHFWADLGTTDGGERDGYAARVLAAGRRDRERILTVRHADGTQRTHRLPSLYATKRAERPAVESRREGGAMVIRINDSLGDSATVEQFDAAMREVKQGQPVVVDLTETPSGGNTAVARAIMGWFVDRPRSYQVHRLPAEERETGIPRQWVEQVLPRPGMHHQGPVEVRVGRWTGSMGEGLAIGFNELGARVAGTRMAGLLGAIYDHSLPASGLVLKFPTERLMTVNGQPRERFVPQASGD